MLVAAAMALGGSNFGLGVRLYDARARIEGGAPSRKTGPADLLTLTRMRRCFVPHHDGDPR